MLDLRETVAAVRADGRSRSTCCPAHDDRRPSLSVSLGQIQDIVLNCHAGCDTDAVLAAGGLTWQDVSNPTTETTPVTSRIVATYTYRDEAGTHLYDIVRSTPKSFMARRPNGVWGIKGVRRVLYRLPELAGHELVFVVEGEEDVDRLASIGVPATTSTFGADSWRDEYVEQLVAAKVKHVVILPDNDDAGRGYALEVARSCHRAGLQVRIVTLLGVPVKGDVSDWFDAGHTRDELMALVEATDLWTPAAPAPAPDAPTVRHMLADTATGDLDDREDTCPTLKAFTLPELEAHVFAHRRALLWRGDTPILREGYLAQIHGLRGIGKTLFAQTLALLAACSGEALGFGVSQPCRVLHIDGEMAGEELKDRYIDLRTRLGLLASHNLTVVAADWQDMFLPRLDTLPGQMAMEPFVNAADLIIIDNRSTLFDPDSEKDPTAWQPAQNWLLSLRRRRKAVIIIHHSNRQGGARGHSKPEDVMNVLLKLTRPEGYTADQGARFLVEFDKARGCHGAAVAPFTASLQADGWHIEGIDECDQVTRKLRNYLHLAHKAGARPKSANAAITGAQVGRNTGLAVWADLRTSGELQQHADGGFYLA